MPTRNQRCILYLELSNKSQGYEPLIEANNVTIQAPPSYNTFNANIQPPASDSYAKPLPPIPYIKSTPTAPPPPYPYSGEYETSTPSRRECGHCRGKGNVQNACATCLGSGFTANPVNPTSRVICLDCNGKAYHIYKCTYCNGIGYIYA
jgi:hypothetical protein